MFGIWERAIESHPDSPKLWQNFIDFAMSNFATFSMNNLRPIFTNAIKILGKQKVRENILTFLVRSYSPQKLYKEGHPKHLAFEYRSLMIVFAAAFVELQSGYEERAMAIFQCMLEANLNTPKGVTLDTPRETFLDLLQVHNRHAN